MSEKTGLVLNIQRFSVHDGPGIRTTVFMKGCNLCCQWCHNPESISSSVEMQYFPERCKSCGACAQVCEYGAHTFTNDGHVLIREKCVKCGRCADECNFEAMMTSGRTMTVTEVMETVRKDKIYYKNSGGGITVSGGEPLIQWGFVSALLELAKREGIHTAIDTALNVDEEIVKKAAKKADMFLIDIKSTDRDIQKKYTGADNTRIIKNIEYLLDLGCKMSIRCPVVKGVNDDSENYERIAKMLRGRENVMRVELLPYHNYGIQKAQSIGLNQTEFETPDKNQIELLKSILEKSKIKTMR